jgi:drug/metabolite transporter (DMT)-like permease
MKLNKGYYFVALAGILSGTIVFGGAFFAKMGLSLFQIAVFRTAFSLILFPYLVFTRDLFLEKRLLKILIIFGLIETIIVLLEMAPVLYGVPVALIVLLLYTAPFWTIIFSKYFFNEEITRTKIIALLLVLAGMVAIVNPLSIGEPVSLKGIMLALAAGIFLSLWTIFGKLCGDEGISPVKTQFYTVMFMFVLLLFLQPIVSIIISDPQKTNLSLSLPGKIWIYLFGFALVSNVIPHVSYYHGVKEIRASTSGIILLLEPISGAILAALFLSQPITSNIFVGGLLILFANYLVIRTELKPPVKETCIM